MLECAARHLDQDTTLLSALARDIQLRMGKAIDHAFVLRELLGCSAIPNSRCCPRLFQQGAKSLVNRTAGERSVFCKTARRWSRQARCFRQAERAELRDTHYG
jgi:hypothetical protein